MGTYIVQADLESCYGVDNIRLWSNLENDTGAADTDRIADAIADAEGDVEDYFREGRRYAIPFVTTQSNGEYPQKLKTWCATLAGYWLYKSRPARGDAGDEYEGRVTDVRAEIQSYAKGGRHMALTKAGTVNPTSPTVVTNADLPIGDTKGVWGSDRFV